MSSWCLTGSMQRHGAAPSADVSTPQQRCPPSTCATVASRSIPSPACGFQHTHVVSMQVACIANSYTRKYLFTACSTIVPAWHLSTAPKRKSCRPASAGDTCGRQLLCGHRHDCMLLCHPGPCPACPRMVRDYVLCTPLQLICHDHMPLGHHCVQSHKLMSMVDCVLSRSQCTATVAKWRRSAAATSQSSPAASCAGGSWHAVTGAHKDATRVRRLCISHMPHLTCSRCI